MLTAQRPAESTAVVATKDRSLDELLDKGWLLTNSRGGYSASSIVCCNTSRYHGLLTGSLNPPADRIMALSNCMETVTVGDKTFDLATFDFGDRFYPEGSRYIRRFRQDTGVHFDYRFERIKLNKSIYLAKDKDLIAIEYDFKKVDTAVEFVIRPFVSLRDFHSLQKSYARFVSEQYEQGLLIRHDIAKSCSLFMQCSQMQFHHDRQWWFGFVYRDDARRRQDSKEDLFSEGFYKCTVDKPVKIVFYASLDPAAKPQIDCDCNIENIQRDLFEHKSDVLNTADKDSRLVKLYTAADQFVKERTSKGNKSATIVAGYPWFMDWGRDAFISLPGLLLETERFSDAKSVLTTFADAADDGMIPNRFDDRADQVHFNSVDASLWFINAAFGYLKASQDMQTFTSKLLPVIRWIIDSYTAGTRFNIHADSDGLIIAGDSQTQLTWMDAKCDGVAFTPRFGKAVEINALWYNALCSLSQFYCDRDMKHAEYYHDRADIVEKSFREIFWNTKSACLNDCILTDGTVDASIRPNQIFAVSLNYSPLNLEQQKSVVGVVYSKLYASYGLRSLDPADKKYIGLYQGPQFDRDKAYHQGTIWAYLIGPFIEAYLKVNDFSRQSKKKAEEFLEPLLLHMNEESCLGQISEIFDGDAPHYPRGCFAQAWSVAEVLRAYKLIHS